MEDVQGQQQANGRFADEKVSSKVREASRAETSYGEITRFYIPLAATSILMMVTHSVISSAVARTPDPAVALAAYSAAYSLGQVFESPCYGMQRMALTFICGKRSFNTVYRVAAQILGLIVFIMGLVSWTPLSRVVFLGVLGVPERVYGYAVASIRVFMLWPVSSAVRSMYQALIVMGKRTYWMTVNMLIRVAVMLGAATFLPRLWPYGPVGATILMLGLSTEALLAMVVARTVLPPLGREPSDAPQVEAWQILRFYVPLALAASLQTVGKPILTAALSRTVRPEITLSGFQVAQSYSYIFAAVTYNIYQAVLVFVRDRTTFRKVQVFTFGLGGIASVLLLICAFPPVGTFIFGSIIGTPGEITREALKVLAIVWLTPFIMANSEFYGGVLMLKKQTLMVTVAKVAGVVLSAACALLLVTLFPLTGAVAGAIAMVLAVFAEAVIAYGMLRKSGLEWSM